MRLPARRCWRSLQPSSRIAPSARSTLFGWSPIAELLVDLLLGSRDTALGSCQRAASKLRDTFDRLLVHVAKGPRNTQVDRHGVENGEQLAHRSSILGCRIGSSNDLFDRTMVHPNAELRSHPLPTKE